MKIEQKILIRILLDENPEINNDVIKKVDFGMLISIASNHLMLPSLYINIIKKELRSFFPVDLMEYLNKIYLLNKERNKLLINEIKIISNILNKNNINHVFLKGAALLNLNLYSDIGERMIGDIDFLIRKDQIKKLKIILDNNKYHSKYEYKFIESRHLRRRIRKDRIFCLEPHIKLLKNNKILDENFILNRSYSFNNIKVPLLEDLYYHNIFNFQINDNGYLMNKYSLRTIYDNYLIEKRKKNIIKNDNNTKIFGSFFFMNYKLGIKNKKLENYNNLYYTKSMFFLSKKIKVIYFIIIYIIQIFQRLELLLKQIVEFCINDRYRAHALNKIIKKI